MAKIGSEHLSAMARQGFHELQGALYPESNVAQHVEYGVFGTVTPGEVAEARRGDTLDLEQEAPRSSSVVDQRMPVASERAQEPREPERGMDRE